MACPRRLLVGSLLALLAAGCEEELTPETVLEDLRVLGIRATPAELRPGELAGLSALVVDPSRPGRRSTLLWVGCDPDPKVFGRSACSDMGELTDPTFLGGPRPDGSMPELPPGMRLIGFGDAAAYRAPSGLFDALAPDDAQRRTGVVAQTLTLAIAEELSPAATPEEQAALFERVRSKEVKSVVALFRIRVSEEPRPNTNPILSGLVVDGAPLPPGATLRFPPQASVTLELTAPDEAFEEYEQVTPDGVEQRTERLIAAWYATAGRFSEPRIALRSETVEVYTAPGSERDPLPPSRSGSLYAVVRDTRGGQAWAEYPFFVCDEALPAPAVTAISPASIAPDTATAVTLSGAAVDSVLDVVVGGQAVRDLRCSGASGVCEGIAPPLPAGDYPVVLRGKHCGDLDPGLRLRVE